MLRNIALKNFKCWQALDINLSPITLFFGTNSSGKTAILQSLLMLKQTARGFDPDQHINFGGDNDYVKLGSYQDLVYEHDLGKCVRVRLKWDTSTTIYFGSLNFELNERRLKSIKYEVSWGIDERIYIQELAYEVELLEAPAEYVKIWHDEENQYRMTTSFAENDQDYETIEPPRSCYMVPWTAKYGPHEGDRISILNLNSEFEKNIEKITYMGPLRARPERLYLWTGGRPAIIEPDGANTIQSLIASHRDDGKLLSNVAKYLQDINLVGSFQVKSIDQNEQRYEATATIGGIESSLADAGFGLSQVLPVITMLLSAPAGSIVLLEQPELHLHPNAQSALADLLLLAAEQRGLQLIVESHSEHLLRRLQRRIAEENPEFANPDNIKMYFCQTGDAGASIREVEIDRFGQIANWPENFLGDISGDIHGMSKAGFERLHRESVRA
ncbi:MAG: DUF3696 domain-containing protein [Chloroflexi bacterium]|nr:DUF3696 domain-containing protein [Chloroflexota bacterium]